MNSKTKIISGKGILLLLLIILANGPVQSGEKIKWYSFEKGSRISYETKKPLLIFFHSDACVYCKKMLHESFSDRSVINRLNESYIPVILNLDRNERNISYNKKRISAKDLFFILEGNALPYTIFLDSRKGSVITTIPGYVNKSMFAPLLEYIRGKCYEKKVSFQDYMGKKSLCEDL
jgi:thioredoxin-related protein